MAVRPLGDVLRVEPEAAAYHAWCAVAALLSSSSLFFLATEQIPSAGDVESLGIVARFLVNVGVGLLFACGQAVVIAMHRSSLTVGRVRALLAFLLVSGVYPVAYQVTMRLHEAKWEEEPAIAIGSAIGAAGVAVAMWILAQRLRIAHATAIVLWGAAWPLWWILYKSSPGGGGPAASPWVTYLQIGRTALFGDTKDGDPYFAMLSPGFVAVWQAPIALLCAHWLRRESRPTRPE